MVARLDDEVTVKRLHRHRGGRIELLPENPDYAPIAVEDHEFAIEGIAVGLIRNGSRM